MNSVATYTSTLKSVLEIIGFEGEELEKFISKFMITAEIKVLKRIFVRLSPEQQSKMDVIMKKIGEDGNIEKLADNEISLALQDVISKGMKPDEITILYSEVLEDQFTRFIEEILDSATEEQRRELEGLRNI